MAFISSSASEFIEMYMGLGAARVRDLFQTVGRRSVLEGFLFENRVVCTCERSSQTASCVGGCGCVGLLASDEVSHKAM